ncbi:hypothetical protein FVEN_g12617 [Fusarium venenatum]|nr:hypothetical protein FVEN_g12617 [Fusarium venenatum]
MSNPGAVIAALEFYPYDADGGFFDTSEGSIACLNYKKNWDLDMSIDAAFRRFPMIDTPINVQHRHIFGNTPIAPTVL